MGFPRLHALQGRLEQLLGFGAQFYGILHYVNGPLCVAWSDDIADTAIPQITSYENVLICTIPTTEPTLRMFKLCMCDVHKCKVLAVRSCHVEVGFRLIDILNSIQKQGVKCVNNLSYSI